LKWRICESLFEDNTEKLLSVSSEANDRGNGAGGLALTERRFSIELKGSNLENKWLKIFKQSFP